MTYVTSRPSLTIFATVPPAPNSESSGCAVTTMTRSILSLNPVSSRFEQADRSHARRSQATHGPTRARGPRYNGATRAVLRPPTVQRVLAVPATTEPRAPFSGHPRSNACSRSPLQRSHARRSQATHGPTRARGPRYNAYSPPTLQPSDPRRSQATHGPTPAPGPRYTVATRAVLRPPTVQRVLAVPATTEPRAPFSGHPRSNACSRSPLQRSHARRSQATHGPTRARGHRYNGATRAVLRPPTVQRVLAVPATTPTPRPRYNRATRAVLRPPTVQRLLPVPATP